MKNSEPLKPCPFCGSDNILPSKTFSPFVGEEFLYSVYCTRCEVQSAKFMTMELAIKAWNTRAEKASDDD